MKQSLYLAGPKTPSRLDDENVRPKGLKKENKEKVVASGSTHCRRRLGKARPSSSSSRRSLPATWSGSGCPPTLRAGGLLLVHQP